VQAARTLPAIRSQRETAFACAVALGLGLLATLLHWHGSDWPGQLYRIDLFRRVGFTQWDNQWYAGHQTPGYSLLFPPLGAVLGAAVVGVGSAVAATACFALLVRRRLAAGLFASVWFGAASVTNLVVGRLTFALGMAIGLGAALAFVSNRRWLAVALAALTPMASPVAGVFVALAAVAWALGQRPVRRFGLLVAAAALVPVFVLAVVFPEGGRFPFLWTDFLLIGAVSAVAAVVLPAQQRTLKIGAALYALAAVVTFLIPNPLGGNITRFGMYLGGPVLAGVFWPLRRVATIVLAIPLCIWQWQPAMDGMVSAGKDPSTLATYYQPLLTFMSSVSPSRIEIPFTKEHWEVTYVAPKVALARGWERQLDIADNALFYAPNLSATAYQAWLSDNAVGYVALADTQLDPSARAEAALLTAGLPALQPVWRSAHWRVWRVTTAKPMVEGPAHLAKIDSASFTLHVAAAGTVLIRIRYSTHWQIQGPGCVAPSPDGWTELQVPAAAVVKVRQVVPFGPNHTSSCPSP
jgi:hypothetical protein